MWPPNTSQVHPRTTSKTARSSKEEASEDFPVLRISAAAAVDPGRRAQAFSRRARRGGAGRQSGLLDGVADRTPFPRGVLPFDGTGDLPRRGEPAYREHSRGV